MRVLTLYGAGWSLRSVSNFRILAKKTPTSCCPKCQHVPTATLYEFNLMDMSIATGACTMMIDGIVGRVTNSFSTRHRARESEGPTALCLKEERDRVLRVESKHK